MAALEFSTIEVEESPEHTAILEGLRAYNRAKAGDPGKRALTIAVREGGRIVAGLNAMTYWGWIFVDHLWVSEEQRENGLGAHLLAMAEETARQRGCRHAYLDTFSFQAPAFYEKQGYRKYGELADFPAGTAHTRHFFHKAL